MQYIIFKNSLPMKIINAFDPDYSLSPEKNYELYLEGNRQFVQLAIYDTMLNTFVGVKQFFAEAHDTHDNILSAMFDNEENLLDHKFQHITFAYSSFRAMLVPQSLFDADHLEDFLKFHHKIDDDEKIRYHFIPAAEAFLIFTCPISMESLLKSKFEHIVIKHHAIPFIQIALSRVNNSHLPTVHLFLGEEFFDMLVMKQGKILLFNSFYYQKYTDVLYFLVNVSNLFSIPPHHSHMFVDGNIEHNQYVSIVNELKTIFPFISEENLPENLAYAKEVLALPAHQLKTLVGLKLCE